MKVGIGSALARIVGAILHDQRAILTVGARSQDVLGMDDVTVSKPLLVTLNDAESAGLRASASVIQAALDELGDNV
jgi:L-lactate dehydrogenase